VKTYNEAKREHIALTYDGTGAMGCWSREPIPAGRQLPKPQPMFKRLEPELADREIDRMGH
jgi:hypothetical protein